MACLKHIWAFLQGWLFYILPAISNFTLVLLGVVMSLPALAQTIEETPLYRRCLAAICVVAGLIGFGFDVSERRNSDQQARQLVKNTDTLVKSTNDLVGNTNQMVASLGLLEPQLTAINDHLATIDRNADEAKKQHNLPLVADLQAQKRHSLDKLLSMAPGIVSELIYWRDKCTQEDITLENAKGLAKSDQERQDLSNKRSNLRILCSAQVRPLITSANYVREELLQRLPVSQQTQDDKRASSIFARAIAGGTVTFPEIGEAGDYLKMLTHKFAPPPQSALSGEVR